MILVCTFAVSTVLVGAKSDKGFRPDEKSIHVFPSIIETNGWQNIEAVLRQDVDEDGLFQDFDAENSAYLDPGDTTPATTRINVLETTSVPRLNEPTTAAPVRSSSSEPVTGTDLGSEGGSSSTSTTMDTADSATSTTDTESSTETEEQVVDDEVPVAQPGAEAESEELPVSNTKAESGTDSGSESDADAEPEATSEESTSNDQARVDGDGLFSRLNRTFAFVQAAVTSVFDSDATTTDTTSTTDSTLSQESDANVSAVSSTTATIESRNELDGMEAAVVASSSVSDSDFATTSEASEPAATESAASSTAVVDDAIGTQATSTNIVRSATGTGTPTTTAPVQSETYSITLRDFSVPELEAGEFVDNLQLRVSMAAQYEVDASSSLPALTADYTIGEFAGQAGSILIEDEVSNALNGGYYLIPLPSISDPTLLSDLSITLRFKGDIDRIEDLFIDAAWLEVGTVVYDIEKLKQRHNPEFLGHLRSPRVVEFLGNQLDFTRGENPFFSFRYSSQRNVVVRTVRSAIGRDLVSVRNVEVLHGGVMPIAVNPTVNVTDDGLVSIVLDDEDRAKLKPGQYTVEIEFSEGGYVTRDSFDFQWGILSINTNQTEYGRNEVVDIAMGALTPNGNTLCNAILDLYIVDPRGYITPVPVEQSDQCNGNNVIDVPDYQAQYVTGHPGVYELYLERLDESGNVIGHTADTFQVDLRQDIAIERSGPTRIYPPSPYAMELRIHARTGGFTGQLVERVPKDFRIFNTEATIEVFDAYQELTWDVSLLASTSESVSYEFDAPDLSPYLYELGPARLVERARGSSRGAVRGLATSTDETTGSSSSTTRPAASSSSTSGEARFEEHRQWQIASDATGNMIIYYDGTGGIPAGWTCLSCGSGTFFQNFAVGSSTYNNTGGATTHTHSAGASVLATGDTGSTEPAPPSGNVAPNTHTHTLTPTIGTGSNLVAYTELRVLQYTAAAGEPANIPTGAIGMFDVASSSLPSGWNRYAALDGRYPYGGNSPGSQAGSNTHTHTVSGTTGVASASTERNRNGGAAGALGTHTHTISTSTPSTSNEPPYIEVLFARLSATTTPPNSLITMWTEDVPSGWLDVSSSGGDPFNNRFTKGATTYGTTGGSNTHNHADMTNITSSVPSGADVDTSLRAGSAGASDVHTHSVTVSSFSTADNRPPFVTAVFGKRQGTDPVYEQLQYRWYTNNVSLQTPTDPWSQGATIDLLQNEPITATGTPVKVSDVIRLRMNVAVSNATATAGISYKLQYGASDTCSTATWATVGDAASSTAWRGYNNSGVSDHSTLSSTTLSATDIAQTYEENGYATTTPNQVGVGEVGEWDFVLEQNGATAGTNYCFRLVESDGTAFSQYTQYPRLFTNEAPAAPTLSFPFDNEKTASTTPWFDFVTTDAEGQDVHYQIQVDDNYDFSSVLIDRDTIDDASFFENQVLISNKAPFDQGSLIRFIPGTSLTNGTTYYWRVRAQDPEGSNEWGSWSTPFSVTIDTSLTISAWYQTTAEQFDTNTLTDLETPGDYVDLAGAASTGTMISTAIDFDDGQLGSAWERFYFSETDPSSVITYQVQYLDSNSSWSLIPDADLAGNSSGFTATTSLLNLDTDTYNEIRLVANFTGSGGSPRVNSWTVEWGYRVETPTLSVPFPNEKVGTTTPIFEFTTTDPQADSLTYQISWSTDNTFTSSTTRTSDTDLGFANKDNGGDTDPFTSGDTIQFTIQPADALTDSTTYWWRVRAKDTTGDNNYSLWSDAQSLTASSGVIASTWFQTTEEQFDSNILSGTQALASDAVSVATTASEAMIVYGEGTQTQPRYQLWNGSTLSGEGAMLDVGAPVRWAIVKAGVTREEYVAATLGSDADINVQVYSTGAWGNLQEVTPSVSDISARGFDVAYESLSGDALVVFCDGDANPNFYTWDGSSWTAGTGITVSETTNCNWIKLASDPISNEIIMLMRGTDGNPFEAQVWNGSAWTNSTTLGSVTEAAHEGMAVEYEESGGQALVVTSDGNPNRFAYNSWNGTAWAGASNFGLGGDLEWATLVPDVGSDEMALCLVDDADTIAVARWSGAAWALDDNLETVSDKTEPGFACVFEDTVGRDNYVMLTYSDATNANYQTYNNTSWSAEAQVNSITTSATMELIRTGVANILGLFFDDANDDLLFSTWNGSSWSSTITLESNASVDAAPFGRPYSMAPRNSSIEGTTIVAPAIDFSDGSGPYWQEMSWVDTTPGASEILYSVQYYDGDSWEFIPNSDLPGNETGTSTSPIDLSSLNVNTYDLIRPYAALTCDGPTSCPEILDWTVEWAEGITVSGTLQGYDQTTNINAGTVAIAINGVLESGKTGSVSGGVWTITNVNTFPGDIITVFVSGAADSSEAVGVTRYDGIGDITGMQLYERHLTLGSDDATTTPMTNADVGRYTVSNTEDVFIGLDGSTLRACATTGCSDVELFISASTTYRPGGPLITHDLENNGTLIATSTLYVRGSWDDNATSTLTSSTVVLEATSTSESIDTTGAVTAGFNNLTFGTTTSSASWSLVNALDVNGDLTVVSGTLNRGLTSITVGGDVLTQSSGDWSGVGTTTFDGSAPATWSDQNATPVQIGRVVIDGTSKAVTLAGNVAAQSILIGANDTLDASVSGYDITVYDGWKNQNNFVPRTGTVNFAATSTGSIITAGGDNFYDLTFSGTSGGWAFFESTLTVSNNLTISDGTVTLPSATTTIAGSFDATGGLFAHSNGVLYFTSNGPETITFDGSGFLNPAHNVTFNGSGSWTINDVNATTTNDIRVLQGSVTFPSGVLAVGGTLINDAGSFSGNAGTVRFYSSLTEVITAGGSSFASIDFDGSGSWSFADANVTAAGDLTVSGGTVTFPSGIFLVGGSYQNSATVDANSGTLTFNSTDTGETVDAGASELYNVIFDSATGGWTLTAPATTTNNFTLTTASDWTLASGQTLAVGTTFTNSVGSTTTTWTGSVLSLYGGEYAINQKTDAGDSYGTIRLSGGAQVSLWNSDASTYTTTAGSALYSQDHGAVDGVLNIYGDYTSTSGTEHWSYATDFDGTDLSGGSERQAQVRFAAGATASLINGTTSIVGSTGASTTISNQGSGTYTIDITGGTTTANYYDFSDLGSSGLSLLGGGFVASLNRGSFEPAVAGGAGLTLSSTTIDANPDKQIFYVRFATTTPISAFNVAQTDGTPTYFWWFRNGSGNLYGEAFDNDTGDPGSVRFDDSSLQITISGVIYSDAGVTTMGAPTCDGATGVVSVYVDGVLDQTVSCDSGTGAYTASNVTIIGDPTITVYLNGAAGGEKASAVTRTPTTDITDLDLYANRVIVRNEDTDPTTIANLAVWDNSDDPDLQFIAATSTTPDTLSVLSGNELYIFASSTFAPGGDVTLGANATADSYDGTLYLAADATFTAADGESHTIGGRFEAAAGATFTPASSTVTFTATTTGKSITAPGTVAFKNLVFTGVGGGWNLGADLAIAGDMTITAGTVTGTGDITVTDGSLTGNGVLSLGAGTTTLERSNILGGNSAWTFHDLVLGNGTVVGTTTPVFTATTTISGELVISNAHFLDAGATVWNLSGSGTVFTETGTFLEDTSTIHFSGNGANVPSVQYYNLTIDAAAGTPTYTAVGGGLIVDNKLVLGGTAPSTFNLDSNDPVIDINGDLTINSNGTFVASDNASTTLAGSYDNNGTFTGSGGTLTFDGSGTVEVAAGASSFSNVVIDGTGTFTVSEHATATENWRLVDHASFTLSSGQTLAVGGQFFNTLGGAATTWTGSTLYLYGGDDYSINTKGTSDTYATLQLGANTQARMWNSSASTYTVDSSASLYSQDHTATDGDLYIWGAYQKTNADDFWSYAYDFDGTSLGGGSERGVDVYLASGASVDVTGGSLHVLGDASATTTIQNQGSGSYGLHVGGSASTTWRYYQIRDIDSTGLELSDAPTIATLSNGDIAVSQNGGTAMTVGGTVITANPAKNFTGNRFALDGVGSGFNVTATGTSLSSWRFTNHAGGIDGEAFDVDPDGDPGYVSWDDSAALITVSGRVYNDDTSTPYSGCDDGATNNIRLYVDGVLFGSVSCASSNGVYSFSNVAYGVNDTLTVYITGETEKGVTVTQDPVSNINGLDIYVNHVIVRHENTAALTIADMEVWDSDDDADIPFDAENLATDTLTLNSDTKLIVWTNKTFAPNGTVTLSNGGSQAYGGSLQLLDDAVWTGAGNEALSIGGSLTLNTGATFTASNGTTTFTTAGAGRTIDTNSASFSNLAFTGSGSWSVSDPILTVTGDLTQSAGILTLPTGTTTVSGSLVVSGGSFDANGGLMIFDGTSTGNTVAAGGSNFNELRFTGIGGGWNMTDTNATATAAVTIEAGTVSLPSGVFAVNGSFTNSGTLTHNSGTLALTDSTSSLTAGGSDLGSVSFLGVGPFTMTDTSLTLVGDLTIGGGAVTFATGTLAIGGSFDATGGTFDHASGTILFNSGGTGEIINPGSSDFYNVVFSNAAGGWTIAGNATTTNNFTLTNANDFTLGSGNILTVEGVFSNNVGGAATTWTGSTLRLLSGTEYAINLKTDAGDAYNILELGPDTDISMWNSSATTNTVNSSASLYSQDHAAVDGSLYIYGDYHIGTTTEYWSYATDFDGTALGGSSRTVTVAIAAGATTTVDGGVLNITGASGNETTITNQGSGTYSFTVSDGTYNALYYAYRNLNAAGLNLTSAPTISSLSRGDFELAVDTGTLISLSSTTLNANASLIITGTRFATTTAISGYNVTLTGTTPAAWTYVGSIGNLDGEDFDIDGVTACGSVRWDDSDCQLTQQTHYRWRNDDGGLEVPDSEWFNSNWGFRKMVHVDNADVTDYTNAAVQLIVDFDSDMQADFDDLRFTDSDGTTLISHWIGSTTNSVAAEVWVQVPDLPAQDTATIFMYYNNATASSTSSSTGTFTAGDDFEDGNISEYSGETGDFTVDGTFAYDGTNALDATANENGRTESGGIYRLDQTTSRGDTIRFKQYIDVSESDETCTLFGVQSSGAPASNYGVCLDLNGTDRLVLVRNAVDSADTSPAVTLDSATISASTGWHTFEIDWATSSIDVALYDDSGTLVSSVSATDTNYTSGGFGFTFWFQHGGWDSFSSRPTLTTEPTIRFGTEQTNGGASWAAALDTAATGFSPGDTVRLRLAVENSGLAITGQTFQLEYAEQGAAPSCEAVSAGAFSNVPSQASCGTSPVCMQASSNVTNGASTVDLLFETEGLFTPGEARENPTSVTGSIDIDQNYYTELEYVITPTSNVTDQNLCFRVTDAGTDYDTYLKVAKMSIRFDPSLGGVTLNGGADISLVGGTTTRIYATSTVTDLNGAGDIALATTTFYHSDATASCAEDPNNCYVATTTNQCSFTNCAGNSCVLECYADFYYFASSTDNDGGKFWYAFMEVEDTNGGTDFDTSFGEDVLTLRAIETIAGAINYGSLEVNQDTAAFNPTTTVANIGNVPVDIEIEGTDLSDGLSSTIGASYQKFASTSFTYSACGFCNNLSSTTAGSLEVDLPKPNATNPPIIDDVFWGIAIPFGSASRQHDGMNYITPVSD